MENTKAKNIVITILVILLLCCLGVIAWQYMQLNDNKEPEVSTQDKVNTENKVEELKREDLDINSELVQKLYGYVPSNPCVLNYIDDGKTVLGGPYQTKAITIDDIDNKWVLYNAFINSKVPEDKKLDYIDGEDNNLTKDNGWYSFKEEVLQDFVKDIYNTTVKNLSFNFYDMSCTYENGIYKYAFDTGDSFNEESLMQGLTKIAKSYKIGNELYIEDNFLLESAKFESKQEAEEAEEWKVEIYNSCDRATKVGEVIENYEKEYTEEELLNKYQNQAQKYKHTFKLSEEGTYYWYSTEPIN